MKYKKMPAVISLVILFALIITGCRINEPHMPSWNVSLNVPLTKKNYDMMELLKKSSELKFYNDNSKLLYYSKDAQLDNISLSNKLTIDGISKSVNQTIGDIKIGSDSVTAIVLYDWAPGLSGGMQTIVPPVVNQQSSSYFTLANQFLSAKIISGKISFTISNQFPAPVSITLSNIKLKNRTGELIAQSNQSVTIPAKGTGSISGIDIVQNVNVKNDLALECNISCSGSNGAVITLPPYSFGVKAKISNVTASEATAQIPSQNPLVIDNTVAIDEGAIQATKFSSLKIDKGSLTLSIDNNIDLSGNVTISIPVLKDSQQKPFTRNYFINRKQNSQVIINNLSLQNYTLSTGDGSATNLISYNISVAPATAPDYRTIKNTDGIKGTISISNLQLGEFSGILKPISVSTQRSSVSLNIQDLKDKLQFTQINFKNPLARLQLNTTAQFELLLNGYIEARNKIGERAILGLNTRTLGSNSIISPTNSSLNINADSLSSFFKSFSILPDSLIVYAGGILNPNYKTISVRNTDQVSGIARLEFPLEVGIKNAIFKDSLNMDLNSDERDQIKNINSLIAGIDITNGLAAAIDFSGNLYDEKNQFLVEFPPRSTNANSVIAIDGAEVNTSGEPIPKTQTITVSVNKTDAEKISRAKYMRVTIKLNTTGVSNLPVKFRTSDIFNLHAFATTNYQVKAKEN